MANVAIDPSRYGNVIARLQGSSSEAVRFAVQAELNAEALDQQEALFAAQLASLLPGDQKKGKQTAPPAKTKRNPPKPPVDPPVEQ